MDTWLNRMEDEITKRKHAFFFERIELLHTAEDKRSLSMESAELMKPTTGQRLKAQIPLFLWSPQNMVKL